MSVEDQIVDHIRDHIENFTLAYQKENSIKHFREALADVRDLMETAVLTEIEAESSDSPEYQ